MSLSIFGVDYAWSKPDPAALHGDGVKFAMRYLSHDASKNLTAGELKRLRNHGIAVGLVWESTANRALSGYAGGVADAKVAASQAAALGLGPTPADWGLAPGLPIYFAVDFDATDAQKPTIATYLKGAASVLGKDHVGVYGGYWVIKHCVDHDVCSWFWQTYAWSGGRVHPKTHIYQYRNGVSAHGGSYDLNHARNDVPFGVTAVAAAKKKAPLRQRLQWRSNVRVLRRILVNHPHWPDDKRAALRWALEKYEAAIRRGTL
jgi:hypothetical protein